MTSSINLYEAYETHYLGVGKPRRFAAYDRFLYRYVKNNSVSKMKILDLGCGDGLKLSSLQSLGIEILVGVDKFVQQSPYADEITFVSQDIFEFIRVSKDRYDIVVLCDIIEHLESGEAISLLSSLKDCLKPQGAIYIRCPNLSSPFAGVYAFGDLTHRLFLNETSLKQLVELAGLDLLQVAAEEGELLNKDSYIKNLIAVILNVTSRWCLDLISIWIFRHRHIMTPNLNAIVAARATTSTTNR